MPQVDLEAIVSAVAAAASCDNKVVACDHRPHDDDDDGDTDSELDKPAEDVPYPDFAPESFWLSKDEEFDWFDRNAFYERKESTKGNSNSNSNSANLNHPGSNSSSQRFNRKSKAALLGLPKPQKSCFDSKTRRNCKPGNARLFPKRNGSVGKADAAALVEPSSPKVSCMGRVRSKRDRNRRMRNRQRSKSIEPAVPNAKPAGMRRSGFFSSFRSMFRSRKRSDRDSGGDDRRKSSVSSVTHDIRSRLPRDVDVPSSESFPRRSNAGSEGEPPGLGLGGMMKFASGRRSDAWANDVA